MPSTKPRAIPSVEFLLHPEHDTAYVHFENAAAHPFNDGAVQLDRRNAWWLADAALLAYWDRTAAIDRFAQAGFDAEFMEDEGLQGYVARTASSVIVTFRGTQPDDWQDLFDDLQVGLVRWDRPGTHVHSGFKRSLDRIWDTLGPQLTALSASRRVWFTGHSLGGALATLAADRLGDTAGVCTIGCPRVGDDAFVREFDRRFDGRALRYVNHTDIVTHLPAPLPFFPYAHVGGLRQIDAEGSISAQRAPIAAEFASVGGLGHDLANAIPGLAARALGSTADFLLDHMPRAYAVDIWNDFALNGD
jgi:triacylglycerol lipase